MRTSPRVLLLATLLSAWWACDSPPAPSPTLRQLVVNGPSQIAPGGTGQFRAIATFSDGSSQDVTSRTVWRSTNTDVLRVSDAGAAHGVRRGEATITAILSRISRSVAVIVLDEGTYKLSGRIVESGGGIANAQVEVVSGTGTGLRTTSGSRGD